MDAWSTPARASARSVWSANRAAPASYARRTAEAPSSAAIAVCVILIAAAVSYVRALVEIAAVGPSMLRYAAAPFGVLIVATVALAAFAWIRRQDGAEAIPPSKNPGELGAALTFALVYAAVLFVVAAVRDWLGGDALYAVAALSGAVDMDAITLSISRMVSQGQIEPTEGWRFVMIATASNMAFKTVFASVVGAKALGLRLAPLFGLTILAAVGMALLWPGGAKGP
ncbi:MAG: DUF4010 domain-containing protein [Phycisphaerales bacterium]|nr:DUF4010 domain-containing protein [Phycisphaerales bacterium]